MHGLKVVIADVNEESLKSAEKTLKEEFATSNVLAVKTDVSKLEECEKLKDTVFEHFGEINILMNNAAVGGLDGKTGTAFANIDAWKQVLDVNLWGVINMVQVFTPVMIHNENPSMIINTGSKQGITNPPGNAAYNVSKAGVRFLTENLAWELRNQGTKLTAHLFVPGWTHTPLTGSLKKPAVPDGAYTPAETVSYLFTRLKLGDFYIICPDHETTCEMDKLRMRWGAEDVSEGRPALSRWHPEYKPIFEEYISQNLKRENGVH